MINSSKKPIILKLLILLISLCSLACLSFYIIVLSGLVPKVQELWVTTAMTTMEHKWLATSFIPQSTIDDIMKRTYVDDSQYATDTSLVLSNLLPNITNLENKVMLNIAMQDIYIPTLKEPYTITWNEPLDPYVTNEGYTQLEDEIYFKELNGLGYKGYILLVTNPARVSLTDTIHQYSQGQTVMQMVEQTNAILGVNAGGFVDGPNYNSNGGIPAGLLIVNNEVVSPKQINNSTKYSVIGFNQDNILVLGKMTTQEAIEANIRDAVNFKPFLIVNGETVIKSGTGGWGIAPRTAIGQRASGEVLFICYDGRRPDCLGVDLKIVQDTLYDEGCINAALVDGGSSTVMVYNGAFLNRPSLGHERWINNAWIVK